MRGLRALVVRLINLLRRRDDFGEELASHLQLHIDDNVRAGMPRDDARRAALVKFGSVEAIKEARRDRRSLPSIDALARDTRDAFRYWRRHPTLSLVAARSPTRSGRPFATSPAVSSTAPRRGTTRRSISRRAAKRGTCAAS